MKRFHSLACGVVLALFPAAALAATGPTPLANSDEWVMAQATPQPSPPNAAATDNPPTATDESAAENEDISIGEIPTIEVVELTAESAKRALDAYVLVGEKYKDTELENYDSLQEFVEQHAQGRAFESDIKAAGFATVDEWNLAITSLGFAYTNIVDNQTDDITQQIDEVKADTEMAQDMKDRMVKSLQAMIPSANNTKIAEELVKDPSYAEKLKNLDVGNE